MKFNEFKNNVEQWAAERGIYEHSTAEAQLMKALSELGELADSIIKGDDEALKDAVGDVVVCVINAAHMESVRLDEVVPAMIAVIEGEADAFEGDLPQHVAGLIAEGVGSYLSGGCDSFEAFIAPITALVALCAHKGLDFMDCCEHAWNEIKDRKGRMVTGGAFVKDEDGQKQCGVPVAGQAPDMPEGWRDQLLREHPNSKPGYWPDSLIMNAQSREIEELRAMLAACWTSVGSTGGLSDEALLRQALEALERGAWDTLSCRNAAFAIRERLGLEQEE